MIIDRLNDCFPKSEKGWSAEFALGNKNENVLEISRFSRGVKDLLILCNDDLISEEAKKLDSIKDFLKNHFFTKCTFNINNKITEISDPIELARKVTELGKKGSQINRYKGLGEMNPVQLWETTLDPNARFLLQVKVENEGDAEETFSTLMGEIVEHRRNFIQDNALNVSNLDV